MPTNWDEIAAYMALTPEQRRAADRAEYQYLPTPGLLESFGYWEEWLGLWQHRPLPAQWPLYEVAFYSKSGGCRLCYAEQAAGGWQRIIGATVASDAELLQMLQAHNFPMLHQFPRIR
jgi:hypothetical protein